MKNSVLKGRAEASSAAIVAIFGFLTAFDSIGIDMYLPAFSEMERIFGLEAGAMSLSLSAFMAGLAVGQALCGPVGDRFGRRLPLACGAALFGAASVLAALAPNFESLLVARVLQGLGGAACLVLPRTITADLCEEKKAASIFTILVQIQSISPIAAPLLGIAMLKATDWTGIFWLLGVCGILGAALVLGLVPESKPKDGSAKSGSAGFRDLLSCRRYWLMNASFAALSALLFGYIAYANFIYATIFGLEAEAFGAVFALNAVGMIGCGFASIAMLRRWALRKSLAAGFAALAASTALLTAASAAFPGSALAQGAALFLMIASLGLIFGGLTSEVMFSVPAPLVGMASAVLGVVQYAAGALSGWIIGLLKPEALLPIALSMLVFALLAAAGWLAGCAVRKPESRSGEPVSPN